MNAVIFSGLSIVLFLTVKRAFDFWKAIQAIQNYPGLRTLLPSYGVLGLLIFRPIKGLTLGAFRLWLNKYDDFQYYGVDIISAITALPKVKTLISVADPAAIKEITSSRTRFPKPVHRYGSLLSFGGNIVASEGNDWKRYRKITAPSFSEPNNKLVWEETVLIMQDLFDNVWGAQQEIALDHVVDITLPIALYVIGVAGFGRRVSWKDDFVVPSGHQMTFKEALSIVSTGVFAKALIPPWIYKYAPSKRLHKIRTAFSELEAYMFELINERKVSDRKEERHDLFTSLLDANEDESDGHMKLTTNELLGNIFIFLIAGHETTAHTLAFTFALLAIYQDEQERLYQHIRSLLPDDKVPTYHDMDKLTYSLAVFNETLRLYPPVNGVPKYAAEDTTLSTVNVTGEKVIVPVPQGSDVGIHIAALHYNPRYWVDPYAFKPDRFLGDWPRDAFLPFSGGARSCLGRRFFETEGIAILTMMVSRYKIEVQDKPQFAKESLMEKRDRILKARPGLTLTPIHVPLVFKRR